MDFGLDIYQVNCSIPMVLLYISSAELKQSASHRMKRMTSGLSGTRIHFAELANEAEDMRINFISKLTMLAVLTSFHISVEIMRP